MEAGTEGVAGRVMAVDVAVWKKKPGIEGGVREKSLRADGCCGDLIWRGCGDKGRTKAISQQLSRKRGRVPGVVGSCTKFWCEGGLRRGAWSW